MLVAATCMQRHAVEDSANATAWSSVSSLPACQALSNDAAAIDERSEVTLRSYAA